VHSLDHVRSWGNVALRARGWSDGVIKPCTDLHRTHCRSNEIVLLNCAETCRRTNEAALQAVGSHLEQLQRAHPAGRPIQGSRFSPSPELPLYVRVEPPHTSSSSSGAASGGGGAADAHPVRASLVLPAVPCWDLSIRCA